MQGEPGREPRAAREHVPGIIETIGSGFAMLNARPYLIWLPILLDLCLWFSARLSVQPFTSFVERELRAMSVIETESLDLVVIAGEQYDLFYLLALGTPSLLTTLGQDVVAGASNQTSITSLTWWAVPLVALLFLLLAIVIGMAYLTLIGYLVRGRSVAAGEYVKELAGNSWRMLGFVLVAIAIFLLLVLPLLLVGTIISAIGVPVLPVIMLLIMMAMFWALFLLFFAQDAIVLSKAGPIRAIYLSYNVVRKNFLATAGFILVYLLIRNGVPLALQIFTQSMWSVPLALIGHAYIATGLVAAAMLFYRDRARALVMAGTTDDVPGSNSMMSN